MKNLEVYEQLALELRAKIISGELAPGSNWPTEREVVREHNVSQSTARKAFRLLISEGLLELASPRRGYRVRNSQRPSLHMTYPTRTNSVNEAEEGESASSALTTSVGSAPDEIATVPGIDVNEQMVIRREIHLISNQPYGASTTYIPASIADNIPELRTAVVASLLTVLEQAGHAPRHVKDTITTRALLPQENLAPGLSAGKQITHHRRIVWDTTGNILYTTITIIPADRYSLIYEFDAKNIKI
ncbi:MAG: GntR family transcriptional regulator [Pseudonocardiaceae bacterium]